MSESKTVIGEGAAIRGQIEGQEDLYVSGRLEGAISTTETLYIEPAGVVEADVTARRVVVHGILLGNIEASESVQIAGTGRMVGDIRAPEVTMNQGAALRGQIDMGDFDLEQPAAPSILHKEPASMSPRLPARPAAEPTRRLSLEPRTATDVSSGYQAKPPASSSPQSTAPAGPSLWPPATSRVPVPRPSMMNTERVAPKRQAPPPKVRNIGRAKARKVSR